MFTSVETHLDDTIGLLHSPDAWNGEQCICYRNAIRDKWCIQKIDDWHDKDGLLEINVNGQKDHLHKTATEYNGEAIWQGTNYFFNSVTEGWIFASALREPQYYTTLSGTISGDSFLQGDLPTAYFEVGTLTSGGTASANGTITLSGDFLWTNSSAAPFGEYKDDSETKTAYIGTPQWEKVGMYADIISRFKHGDEYSYISNAYGNFTYSTTDRVWRTNGYPDESYLEFATEPSLHGPLSTTLHLGEAQVAVTYGFAGYNYLSTPVEVLEYEKAQWR